MELAKQIEEIANMASDSMEGNLRRVEGEDPNIRKHSGQIDFKTHASILFISLSEELQRVAEEIKTIHKDSQYNQKTCSIFLSRIDAIIRADGRRNVRSSIDQDYLNSFSLLYTKLEEIKDFLRDISQLKSYHKFHHPTKVKEKCSNFLDDLERICQDLQTDVIPLEGRRNETASLEEDEKAMIKFFELIEDESETNIKLGTVFDEILKIRENISRDDKLDVPQIPSAHLTEPPLEKSTDSLGKVYKQMFRSSVPVACKPLISDDSLIKGQLAILNKINVSKNVIKFHGISTSKNRRVIIVYSWAEHGNLREVYKTKELDWASKIRIARDICKGLTFLHACDILHHDIRCENILVTGKEYYEAKIANIFKRELSASSTSVTSPDNALRWMAPEKILETLSQPVIYDYKCEIFSFGMLLWELAFQKIPYKDMEFDKIKDHVTSEHREALSPGRGRSEIVGGLRVIIEACWKHNPKDRPWIKDVFIELSNLVDRSKSSQHIRSFTEKNISSDDSSNSSLQSLRPVLQLGGGLKAHKAKDYEKAWKCFEMRAELGDLTAKVWKGFYLSKGYYVPEDEEKAVETYKEAADAGDAEGQLRYAFCMLAQRNYQDCVKYMRMSADNGNPKAQFHMNEIYMSGKMGVVKDVNKGLRYLKLAARNNEPRAIEALRRCA